MTVSCASSPEASASSSCASADAPSDDSTVARSAASTIRQGRWDQLTSNLPSQAAVDAYFSGLDPNYVPGSATAGSAFGFNPDGSLFDVSPVINFTGDTNEPLQPVNPASYTYNYNDGFNWSESDSDDDEFEFSDHYYERGAELKSHTAALFSNWTDQFSTEVRVSSLDLDNRQVSRAGGEFGELQVETWNDDDGDGSFSRAIVYMGTDDSRQANKLSYEALNIKLAANYELGDHLLTAGFEQDDLDVYNLFIQHVRTENRFDEECGSSNPNGCIDAFREGRPDDIYYGNAAPSNNPQEGAAIWGYKINTAYLQDEWITAGGDLTLVFGLRYDWYSTSDRPAENAFFEERNGFKNTANLDGEGLLQPRIGFNWTVNPDLSVRGGLGLYSGGNPNVWLSNNYSNDGIRVAQVRESVIERDPPPEENCGYGRDFSLFDIPLTGGGNPLYDVPQCQFDAIAFADPDSGVTKPKTHRIAVVLPAPLGPRKPRIRPGWTAKLVLNRFEKTGLI